MKKNTDIEQGWAFASHLAGADCSSESASSYVAKVKDAIDDLEQSLLSLKSKRTVPSIGGDAAEHWHAGTFNIDAVASGSSSRAEVLTKDRHIKWSTDVRVTSENGSTIDFGSKYRKYANQTADDQSLLDISTRKPGYEGQKRLVPSDQKDDVIRYAHRKASTELRSDVADAYADTAANTVDVVSDDTASSTPLSKDEDLEIAREIKEDRLDLEKHGVSADSAIKPEYIMKQAVKAGLSAATITMIMQTAPEIFKAIDYLIKTGEIDVNQVKKIGTKAISSGVEGFLRGSVACTLQIFCEKGAFGVAFQNINPTVLGTLVSLTLETVKNAILVSVGKMTSREMGNALVDGVVISTGYVIGAEIGGIIGQALGFELPVIGYILGSLIGCSFAAVYNFGKKKLISFCVDTGFTCFGLVEQDYQLPEKLLKEMGIDITPILRTEVSRTDIDRISVRQELQQTKYETVDIKVLRRGIIGVNKVGYVY